MHSILGGPIGTVGADKDDVGSDALPIPTVEFIVRRDQT
jgi:hypothetical protein